MRWVVSLRWVLSVGRVVSVSVSPACPWLVGDVSKIMCCRVWLCLRGVCLLLFVAKASGSSPMKACGVHMEEKKSVGTAHYVCWGWKQITPHTYAPQRIMFLCTFWCMFLDVGNVLRITRLLLTQLLCRQLSNYETRSINLVTMNARKQLCSYLYVPQWFIAVSFNKCTLCKLLCQMP